jgi:hypothetical protein
LAKNNYVESTILFLLRQKHLNKFGAIERKLNYLDVVKSGILPPDSVVTILTPLEKPVAPKIRHYEPPKKTTE